MAVIPLKGARRPGLGKGGARQARAAGQSPGVLYGHGETPIAVAVGSRDFDVALRSHKGSNPIVNLAIDSSEYTALIRDVQYDPLDHKILHLDFQHISLTEAIEVDVPVHLVGIALGVKDGGGILEHPLREVKVRCLPTAIPTAIDVDVTALNIGDSLHVRDLVVGDLEVLSDPNATIALVSAPTAIEEPTVDAAAAAVAAAELEVIAKGKKDEEGEEGKEKDKDKGAPKGKEKEKEKK